MPYGFPDLPAYLRARCKRAGVTPNALALKLGWPRNYIHALIEGRFKPSRTRARAIAAHFGDAPEIVFVLAGLQPAPAAPDRLTREIAVRVASLPRPARRELLRFLDWLSEKYA